MKNCPACSGKLEVAEDGDSEYCVACGIEWGADWAEENE